MLSSMCRFLLLFSLCAVSGLAFANLDIQVQGLFSGRAMISIDGNVQLLRAGETSAEGVTLISADSKQAVVKYEGDTHKLGLSDRVAVSFDEPENREVRLRPDNRGHYSARVNINGRTAEVLVDTGATFIAMNEEHAKSLGINLDDAQKGRASTAGGIVETKVVTLSSVSIGGITRNSVLASVQDGDFPQTILLGNSFLSGLDMTTESGVLVLRQKF